MGDGPAECNIKVICRVRPLNESEERAGSKFVLKFPTDDSLSIAASSLLVSKSHAHTIRMSVLRYWVKKNVRESKKWTA